ncbi:MAG: ATP-dependent Clp protease ATP-binding subunit [Anaerolineae bacterium]|nr:ATP-dependent Clp protease ATP-binding subunit [Anaerolineae bacterium]
MSEKWDKFTSRAQQAMALAKEEAQRFYHTYIGSEHLLYGLIKVEQGQASKVLRAMGLSSRFVQSQIEQVVGFGPRSKYVREQGPLELDDQLKSVIAAAVSKAQQMGHTYVDTAHLLLALVEQDDSIAINILRQANISPQIIQREMSQRMQRTPAGETAPSQKGKKDSVLEQLATDLTAKASAGQLDPVIGRETEIERVIQILSRRTKNNPALIGEPGVGKTAIVEGIAQRIISQNIPYPLRNKKLWQLDVGSLVAGTMYRGQFEERLKKVIDELKNSDSILFIDEVHMLVGAGSAGSSVDAANILKPALSRGELQCIGATTMEEYRKHIESDAALERRFQPITVDEPSIDESIAILRGIRPRYEAHHNLHITNEAIDAAVHLASRYITQRYLPDKAIDLIDEGAARVRMYKSPLHSSLQELQTELQKVRLERDEAVTAQLAPRVEQLKIRERELLQYLEQLQYEWSNDDSLEVQEEDIAELVSMWTGIPLTNLQDSESERLLNMEEELHRRVIGQDQAIEAIARAVRRSRSGLKDPYRPIGSFIFIGPTGVGKTELAKALAYFMFGKDDALMQLDMSEFMERHTVARLVGAPPGYVGYEDAGQLTESVRRRPYQVICFDEVDKAHPETFGMLLQILEEGQLSDARGRKVDFRNTIIIMTSNVGTEALSKGPLGIRGTHKPGEYEEKGYESELKQLFRPEFLNRVDQIVVFHTLTPAQIEQIVDLELDKISQRLREQDMRLEATLEAKHQLAEQGYSQEFGARNLRRIVQQTIEDTLSEGILSARFVPGDTILVDVQDDQIVLNVQDETPEPPLLEIIPHAKV